MVHTEILAKWFYLLNVSDKITRVQRCNYLMHGFRFRSAIWIQHAPKLIASDRRSSSAIWFRSAILIPNTMPNPSRSEPNNFSFNSLLGFRLPIWTHYPYLIQTEQYKIRKKRTCYALSQVSLQSELSVSNHPFLWYMCSTFPRSRMCFCLKINYNK